MTQMESPKRKMQKKNDYQRHKLFRKIKRRRKAQAEAEQHIAEKQLRRKLKLPKFGDGKEKVNLDNAHFDKEGNLVDNTTGVKYTPTSDDIVITPKLDVGDPTKIHEINISDPRLNTVIGFHPSIGVGGFKTPDGKDYQRAYNSADANTKKQMSNKARNMFKLAAIGGVGITTANKVNSDKSYNSGKDIHIKKSKRGTFTKAAKQHGMSVQSFANKVLKNPSKYSAAMRKKANFAHNAASWNH